MYLILLVLINLIYLDPVLGSAKSPEQDSLAMLNRIETNLDIAQYFLTSQPNVTILYADSAESISQRMEYHYGLYKARELKALALKKKRNYEQAINYFDKALGIANITQNHDHEAKCYYEIGDIHVVLKNYDQALQNYKRAMKNESKIKSTEILASIYAGLWTVYWYQDNFSLALKYQEKAIRLFNENSDNKEILNILIRIGDAFKKADKLDEALDYYLNSLETHNLAKPNVEIAKIWVNIGEIYYLQKNNKLSLHYFEKAAALLESGNKKAELANAYLHLAKAQLLVKNYDAAVEIIRKAMRLTNSATNLDHQAEGQRLLSLFYENTGRLDSSLYHYKLYTELKEQLLNKEIAQKIADITTNYEFNQKEREITVLAKEKEVLQKEADVEKLKNRIKGYIIGLLILMVFTISVLSYLIWKESVANRKANQIITTQMEEISFQKEQVEKQRDIISKNNLEMEKAQGMIRLQNLKLKEINERLEEKVKERSAELYDMFQKLSFHIDNTPLAIMEWNDQLKLTRWSKQAEEIFGHTSEEILGMGAEMMPIIHNDDRKTITKLLEDLLNKKKPRNFNKIKGVHRNGRMMFLEWSNSIFFDSSGQMQSILSIANDVSDREHAYVELQELNQELDNFIYHASHDLQGPLSRMKGLIYLGRTETKDETSVNYLNMLDVVNNELNNILDRLRLVYNFYQRALESEKVNVKQEVEYVVEKVKKTRKIKDVKFVVNIHTNTQWSMDKLLFNIIVENMIENALNYKSALNSHIEFSSVKNTDGTLSLIVRDNGIGIREEQAHRIFDLFFRGTLNPEEAGMNLYIVKKAINRLGGGIVLVKPANDTVFEITLPDIKNKIKNVVTA